MTVVNSSPPVISGNARVGQRLSTSNGTWTYDDDYLTYEYQWERCDASGSSCSDIPDAISNSFLLTSADVGHTLRSRVTATEHTSPVTDLLPWAPPTLYPPGANLVEWTMTNANRQDTALVNGGGRDLVITCAEDLTGPVFQIGGGGGGPWRNVVWIGGKITDTGPGNHYALAIAATGTVHLEGLSIRADGDVLACRGGGPSAIWQVQNCRHEVHYNGTPYEHADCFQFQGGTKLDELRFARCTMITDYQGFMLRFPDAAAYMNSGDFRQLNFRRRVPGVDPAQAYLFIPDEDPAMGHGPGQTQIGEIQYTDVYIEHSGDLNTHTYIIMPSWKFDSSFSAGGWYSIRRGAFKETDATGEYLRPSDSGDVVPPGGTASGQSCLTPHWAGKLRFGVPAGGDYCPSSVPGTGYVSPGYV